MCFVCFLLFLCMDCVIQFVIVQCVHAFFSLPILIFNLSVISCSNYLSLTLKGENIKIKMLQVCISFAVTFMHDFRGGEGGSCVVLILYSCKFLSFFRGIGLVIV